MSFRHVIRAPCHKEAVSFSGMPKDIILHRPMLCKPYLAYIQHFRAFWLPRKHGILRIYARVSGFGTAARLRLILIFICRGC